MSGVYENFIDKIAERMVADNSIDSADAEAYKFGIEVTILKFVHFISYAGMALCMKKFVEFVIIFAVFYAFRRNTGGFHAKTRLGCYLFSCAVIFLSLLATELNFRCWGTAAISILDLAVLFLLAPVQNSNRGLEEDDIKYFRHRLILISAIYLILYIVTTGLGVGYFIKMYTIGLTLAALLTGLGKMQELYHPEN